MLDTIEKIKRLEQYLTLTDSTIDSVLETTITKLLTRESNRIIELRERLINQLQGFEERYKLKSEHFYTCYEKGEMGDEMDFVEWASTIEMVANINARLAVLHPESPYESDN